MSLKERWESDDQMFYYAGLKEKIIPMIIGGAVEEILGVLVKGRKRDSYVVHTLEAAIWCFFQHDNYKDSIIEAVNLGGDTNRIAFITGTMAGLYYKIDSIPQDWTKNLVELENIEHICEEYCKFFVKKEYGNKTNYERLNMKKISHSICIPLV